MSTKNLLRDAGSLLKNVVIIAIFTLASSVVIFWIAARTIGYTATIISEDYTKLEGFSGIANVAVTVISVGIAWLLFVQSEQSRKLNRKADVIISCIQRYDDISNHESKSHPTPDLPKAQDYFSKYYALKSDQVDFYLAGWIDTDTFITWMKSMIFSLKSNRKYYGFTLSEGWKMTSSFHAAANSTFFQLMNGVKEIVKESEFIENENSRDEFIRVAFEALMIRFYEKTVDLRRLLLKDFSPSKYFMLSKQTIVFNEEIRRDIFRKAKAISNHVY